MLSCALLMLAQSISVSSFQLLENDLTANTAGTTERDQNGEVAALIKVVTTQTGFTFDGGALGIVKTKQTPGEVWVYIPRGAKKITIKHPQLGVLRDYYFPCAIDAARTYEMILVTGTVETTVRQTRTSQYVVFQLTPPNAVVELNGELLQTADGTASKMMKFGTYGYRVNAPNYLPESGNVTVNDPNNKHVVNIALKPNFSQVTLTVDNNAEIWVNGERKGTGSWTGNLGAGTYELETRLKNHRSQTVTRDVVVTTEPQTIRLQAPIPIYGEADMNSSPAMADIYIDGKKVGQTPQLISNLLIGEHQYRLTRKGYADYTGTMNIREGETAQLSATLKKEEVVANTTVADGQSRKTFTVGNVSFTMIRVDGGTFQMGDGTTHTVTLSPYFIGETEVTQALWEAVMGSNPSNFKGTQQPVESVSWDDCQDFIRKLNQQTGQRFRLPTEAEWEFAAKGGKKSAGFEYSGSDNLDNVGWYWENSGVRRLSGDWDYDKIKANNCKPHDVKTKQANELGLYDMSGNVWEWCQDWYGDYPSSGQTNPTGPASGSGRVGRGGGWFDDARFCRVSFRNYYAPDGRGSILGLRLALQ